MKTWTVVRPCNRAQSPCTAGAAKSAQAQPALIDVMTQNQYLGADLVPVIEAGAAITNDPATLVALNAALLNALGMVAVTGAALAGEITGNGKSLKNPDGTLNGRSACAFSGRDDGPGDPLFRGAIAQSWGQISIAIRDSLPAFLHPGVACNPQRSQGE